MKYEVIVMPRAQAEMDAAFEWLAERTAQHAPLWYNGLIEAILSLEEFPERCAPARDVRRGGSDIRQLLYGERPNTYRIIFRIRGHAVEVLQVRHTARD